MSDPTPAKLNPILALLAFLGFDQPDVVRRWLLKLLVPAVPFANLWLTAHGLPALPDTMTEFIVGSLVTLILAAEAKAMHANHLDVKAQVAAGLTTPEAVQAPVVAPLPPGAAVPAPAGVVNPAG